MNIADQRHAENVANTQQSAKAGIKTYQPKRINLGSAILDYFGLGEINDLKALKNNGALSATQNTEAGKKINEGLTQVPVIGSILSSLLQTEQTFKNAPVDALDLAIKASQTKFGQKNTLSDIFTLLKYGIQ